MHHVLVVAADQHIGWRNALDDAFRVALIHGFVLVLGAGDEALRGYGPLRDIVAAGFHPAPLCGLQHNLGAVHVADDHVAPGVDQGVGDLGLAHRKRPFAGEHDLHHYLGIDFSRREREGVDVSQHDGDGLGGYETDLVHLGAQGGGGPVDVMSLVEQAEIPAEIHRVLVLVPQGGRVAELHVRIFLRHVDHVRIEIAVGVSEDEPGAVLLDH